MCWPAPILWLLQSPSIGERCDAMIVSTVVTTQVLCKRCNVITAGMLSGSERRQKLAAGRYLTQHLYHPRAPAQCTSLLRCLALSGSRWRTLRPSRTQLQLQKRTTCKHRPCLSQQLHTLQAGSQAWRPHCTCLLSLRSK